MEDSLKVDRSAFSRNASWPWFFASTFVFSLLIQIYDPLIKHKLQFPISPWELDGRIVFVNSFEKNIYWGRPVQGLLQMILPSQQNWYLMNMISLASTPVICMLAISIAISPKTHPYYFMLVSVVSMLILRSTSGFVSSWAYMSVITNGLATFLGLLALLILLKLVKSNSKIFLYSLCFVACTLLSVLSKQDAIFGLALAGLVVFTTQISQMTTSFWRKNPHFCLTLFPMMVLAAEYLRNKYSQTFFSSNTGTYTRVLNPVSILDSFFKYPGAGTSRFIFCLALASLIALTIKKIFFNNEDKMNDVKSGLNDRLRTSSAVIAFGLGLRFPYLILPYHQFDWYSNYWLLVDFAALSLLAKTLFSFFKPTIRAYLIVFCSACFFWSSYLPGNREILPNDRIRVEGWFVQRVKENENIVKFLKENSPIILKSDCVKVLNTNFETPWIFDTGAYLQRLLGKEIKWSVEVSDETYAFIRQFPEFEYMSSLSDQQDIAIYSSGMSPEMPDCGVIRFDGELSGRGRILKTRD